MIPCNSLWQVAPCCIKVYSFFYDSGPQVSWYLNKFSSLTFLKLWWFFFVLVLNQIFAQYFEDQFTQPSISSHYIYLRAVAARGTRASPDFDRLVNPISTRGTDYAHHITKNLLAPSGCSDLPTAHYLFYLKSAYVVPQKVLPSFFIRPVLHSAGQRS